MDKLIEVQRYSVCDGWVVADEGGRLVTYEAFRALEQRAQAAEAEAEDTDKTMRAYSDQLVKVTSELVAAQAKLAAKPQPVAVVVGKLGAGIRATAFEAAPRPELGQLLYDAPAAPVKLPPKSDVKMGGDVKTRSLLTGMNMMRKSCAEAIRAAGYEVEE